MIHERTILFNAWPKPGLVPQNRPDLQLGSDLTESTARTK